MRWFEAKHGRANHGNGMEGIGRKIRWERSGKVVSGDGNFRSEVRTMGIEDCADGIGDYSAGAEDIEGARILLSGAV